MLNEVKAWIEQGKRDFRSAKNSFKSEDYYVSALLCQQAVEKWLKAILIRNGEELLKIHDLVKLSRKVNAPEEVISMCAEVDPVYF